MDYSKLNIFGTELEHLFTNSCGPSIEDDFHEMCPFCGGKLFRGMKASPAYTELYGKYVKGEYHNEGIICKKCGEVATIKFKEDGEDLVFLQFHDKPAPFDLYSANCNDEKLKKHLYKALMGNDLKLIKRLLMAMSNEYTDQFYLESIVMFCQLTWDPLNVGKEDYLDVGS